MIKRKLNNLLQRNNSAPEKYQWSSQSYNLRHITTCFKLPCVVKCSVDNCFTEWRDFRFDLTQPILLHSVQNSRKIRARCLKKDEVTGEFIELEHANVIPEQYEGWFQIVETPGEVVKPEQSVQAILRSSADQFVLANSIEGLDVLTEADGSKLYEKKEINSGEILRVKCTYGDDLRQTSDTTGDFDHAANTQERPVKYILCSDEKDDEFLLPVAQTGKFYKIYDSEELGNGLIEVEDLIDKRDVFPLLVRHVIGDIPTLTTAYSTVMKCYDVIEEQTILASTLDSFTMSLLELQTSSPIKFKMALNEGQIKTMDTYTEAIQLCNNTGEDYMSSIKVAFKFSPEMLDDIKDEKNATESDRSDQEENDTSSELVEEDANSEFSFEWTPETIKPNKSFLQKMNQRGDKGEHNGSDTKIPKFFNSCINNPKAPSDSNENKWNEQPDIV